MTASPPLNGHARPPLPVLGDWQSVAPEPEPESVEEQRIPQPGLAESSELVAQAKAEAIRAKAWADAEAQRVAAETEKEAALRLAAAEAEAIRVKAEEEARKLALANDRAERKSREEEAASEARIADHNRRRDEAERARVDAARQNEDQQAAEDAATKEIEAADEKWRAYAIRFAIVCGIVSLPVQMSFFWNPRAPWMAAAPIMLEGAAWVVHRGARAAAVSKRPVWHYRTIVWLLALIAAGVNLYHGLHSFDPGTAVATAFASIAGPGVWDLHENGRIRRRDGALTRRERKAQTKAAKAEAKRLAAEEEQRVANEEAVKEAAEAAAVKLATDRESMFPKVWEHAVKLAADLGETSVTDAIWAQAKLDVEGAKPGESAEVIRMRNAAQARVEAARQNRPVNTVSKTTNAQRANQMPRHQRGPARKPPIRQRGDTAPYVSAARKQAAITALNAAKNPRPNGN